MEYLLEIIVSTCVVILGAVLRQYFTLKHEMELIKLSLAQNYATNASIERLAKSQEEMLNQLIQLRIDYATLFERERQHHEQIK